MTERRSRLHLDASGLRFAGTRALAPAATGRSNAAPVGGEHGEGTAGSVRGSPDGILLVLTPRCLVTVRADGVQLQGAIHAAPFYLGLPELEILAAVDTAPIEALDQVVRDVARRTNTEATDLAGFV